MPKIAHRRRGSKFGRRPGKFFLVTPRLLPLASSTSDLCHSFVFPFPLSYEPPATHRSGSILCL